MKDYELTIRPHYNASFMCKVCRKTGMANWQPENGAKFTCERCGTEHEVIIKLRVRTKHTKKYYKALAPGD